MNQEELNAIAKQACRSTECAVCGVGKRREDAFCVSCYAALPGYLQNDLWRGWRGTMNFRVHQYSRCYAFLMNQHKQERDKFLEDVEEL
jgi:hypothetical protein